MTFYRFIAGLACIIAAGVSLHVVELELKFQTFDIVTGWIAAAVWVALGIRLLFYGTEDKK